MRFLLFACIGAGYSALFFTQIKNPTTADYAVWAIGLLAIWGIELLLAKKRKTPD